MQKRVANLSHHVNCGTLMLLIATLEVKPLQIVFIYQLRDNSGVIQLAQYQHLQVSKEMPTRHHYGEIHNKTLSRNTTFCSASLKCLYTDALDVSNKQDELETCTCLEGSDLIWIMETWDGSHDWSAEMEGQRLSRKDRPGEMRKGISPSMSMTRCSMQNSACGLIRI